MDEFKNAFRYHYYGLRQSQESCPIFPGQPIVAMGHPDPLGSRTDEQKLRHFRRRRSKSSVESNYLFLSERAAGHLS
jgi:hypothetical protein